MGLNTLHWDLYQSRTMNRCASPPYQGPRAHRQGIRDMDENSGPARRDQIGARSAAHRSGEPGWGLLVLVWFAGNVVVATLAWFLVGLFLK
jgi:hypothetical protein